MARTGSINKNDKVAKLVKRQAAKRSALKAEMRKARKGNIGIAEAMEIQEQMNKLGRNGSKVRLRNRCMLNGRPRGYMRKFGINRYSFRLLASEGQIPGVVKSSW